MLELLRKLPEKPLIDTTPALLEAAPYKTIQTQYANPKLSAVLIPLVYHRSEWQIIMIIRPEYDGHHSGQIAFPGGKVEPDDASTKAAALRETHEEIGLSNETLTVSTRLTEIYIPTSRYLIHPYVGYSANLSGVELTLDKTEVEDVIFLPVRWLLNTPLTPTPVTASNNTRLKAPAFVYHNHIIWGASCMMLNELKFLLQHSEG